MLLAAGLTLLAAATPVGADTTPVATLVPIATGLTSPVFVTNAGDGSGRLFIVEQGGTIRIVQEGSLLPTPFLDIHTAVTQGGEQGLLGLAFHPDYATNRKFYVYFTNVNGNIAINEYRASTGDPDIADTSTARRIITITHPPATNHNGGMLAFGKDGYLYIGTGDGGGAGNPGNSAQDRSKLLGKILRLDVNGTQGSLRYRIPGSNPFVGKPGADEVWSYGLRNPWRFSFDRLQGDIWVADVGQYKYEEVNRMVSTSTTAPNGRGSNYGWRILEGSHCYNPPSGCGKSGKVLPITEYTHAFGCAVTGGYVYRGTLSPSLAHRYVFGDFCTGTIWTVARSAHVGTPRTVLELSTTPPTPALNISSFGEDEAGELYVVDLNGGVYRLDVV